jgi:ABC-type nickel/cobalt efflux system permease component RcnA
MDFDIIGRIAFLAFLLGVCAGIIVLQIYLSKKENKWAGLILPSVSLGITLMALLGVLMFSVATETMTHVEDGEIIEQTTTVVSSTPEIIAAAVYLFLLFSIPTAILLAIYIIYRGKRSRQRALDKMSVQDL